MDNCLLNEETMKIHIEEPESDTCYTLAKPYEGDFDEILPELRRIPEMNPLLILVLRIDEQLIPITQRARSDIDTVIKYDSMEAAMNREYEDVRIRAGKVFELKKLRHKYVKLIGAIYKG